MAGGWVVCSSPRVCCECCAWVGDSVHQCKVFQCALSTCCLCSIYIGFHAGVLDGCLRLDDETKASTTFQWRGEETSSYRAVQVCCQGCLRAAQKHVITTMHACMHTCV